MANTHMDVAMSLLDKEKSRVNELAADARNKLDVDRIFSEKIK